MLDKGKHLATLKKRYKEGDEDVTGAILWEGLFGVLEYKPSWVVNVAQYLL
jgi:hypothetical protein